MTTLDGCINDWLYSSNFSDIDIIDKQPNTSIPSWVLKGKVFIFQPLEK